MLIMQYSRMINFHFDFGYLYKVNGTHSTLLHKILVIVSIYLHSMSTLAQLEKIHYN